jgi:putative addiction module component (TIGR02574 family)
LKSLSLLNQNTSIMGAAQIREELHQFIEQADERVLTLIYGMMKADKEGLLTVEQQADLDKRIERHKNGESKSYSWAEVRAQIEKRG